MTHDHIESRLQQRLRQSESQIDAGTSLRLQEMRKEAIAEENRWFAEYIQPTTAGVVCLLLMVTLAIPLQSFITGQGQELVVSSEPIDALMEDPSFYIWLEESGRLVADR
jgi:hypothetical protein